LENQPDGLVYAGKVAYTWKGDKSNVNTVILKDDTTSIAVYLFERGDTLTSITIPESVIYIGAFAFEETNLTTVTIPQNVKYIGEGAFSASLKTILFDSPVPPEFEWYRLLEWPRYDCRPPFGVNTAVFVPFGSAQDYREALSAFLPLDFNIIELCDDFGEEDCECPVKSETTTPEEITTPPETITTTEVTTVPELSNEWESAVPFQEMFWHSMSGKPISQQGSALIRVQSEGKFGIVNGRNGKVILPFEYDMISQSIYEGFIAVSKDGGRGFVNIIGEISIPLEYDGVGGFFDGLSSAKKGDKWGVIDTRGRIIIPFEYDEIWGFNEGVSYVRKGEKIGFINALGEIVIPIEYDVSEFIPTISEGLVTVRKGDKVGVLNMNGEVVIPFDDYYWIYSFQNGFAPFCKGSRHYSRGGLMNSSGEIIIPVDVYDFVQNFDDGLAMVMTSRLSVYQMEIRKHGFINMNAELVVPLEYDDAYRFNAGMAAVAIEQRIYSDNSNDKVTIIKEWGFINTSGEVVVSIEYDRVKNFSEGLAAVEKNGKWGYVNTNGETIIPFDYSYVGSFEHGFAEVRKDRKRGFINLYGEEIVPIIYDEVMYVGNVRNTAYFWAKQDGLWKIYSVPTACEKCNNECICIFCDVCDKLVNKCICLCMCNECADCVFDTTTPPTTTQPPVQPRKLGDITGTGEVTIEDALEILKYLAGIDNVIEKGGDYLKAALITGGDEPTIDDVLEILKYLAGMENRIDKSFVNGYSD
jgi:hypothetical protein